MILIILNIRSHLNEADFVASPMIHICVPQKAMLYVLQNFHEDTPSEEIKLMLPFYLCNTT